MTHSAFQRGLILLLVCQAWGSKAVLAQVDSQDDLPSTFQLEGKVLPPDHHTSADWYWTTRILVDGGERVAFITENNSFTVLGLTNGSYLVEVVAADYYFEPVRVDVNSKGKIRARKVNNIQPGQVNQVPYPLKFKTLGRMGYFQRREEWKIIPKMLNDPEARREMEQMQQNMNVQNQIPDVSEYLASFFGGSGAANDRNRKKSKPPLRSK